MERLTFKQRNGLAPVPTVLNPGELSKEIRNKLWFEFHKFFVANTQYSSKVKGNAYSSMAENFHETWVHLLGMESDSFRADAFTQFTKTLIFNAKCEDVINFLDYIIGTDYVDGDIVSGIYSSLKLSAYRINEKAKQIYVVSSAEQGEAVANSLNTIFSSKFNGVQTHIRKATEFLNQGQYRDSIRESIHAVESALRVICGEDTLPDCLKVLAKNKIVLHPALKVGLEKIYSYTSDKEGIRHSLKEDTDFSSLSEAVLMFGLSTSFCGYFINVNNEKS